MNSMWLKTLFVLLITLFCFVGESTAQNDKEHLEVAMRMIGHQILLNSGDNSSLVLPIENEGNKFRIRFESEFQFVPNTFAESIDSIVRVTKMATSYRVEVEDSGTRQIVYSYEVDSALNIVIPCGVRSQPKKRYSLLVTILDTVNSTTSESEESLNQSSTNYGLLISILVVISALFGFGFYFWKQRSRSVDNSTTIKIGKYRFDQRNMKLLIKKESIDLTSKEADLLTLLHSSLDVTLERELILKVVWGDEGDYVGRTLDVFISKLRKKFAEDPTVKIMNVRGVGYKLMLDASSINNG